MRKFCLAAALVALCPLAGAAQIAGYTYIEGWRPSTHYDNAIDLYFHGQLVGSLSREGYWLPAGSVNSIDIYAHYPDAGHRTQKGIKNFGNDWQGSQALPMPRDVSGSEKVTINGKQGTIDEALQKLTPRSPGPMPPGPGPGPCPCPCPLWAINWPVLIAVVGLGALAVGVIVVARRRKMA